MSETMNIEKLQVEFDSEWVLIGDPVCDETMQLVAGRVLFHSKDRDAVYQKAAEIAPGRFAVRYLGDIPHDMEFVL